MDELLRYQSFVLVGGVQYICIESYDSVLARINESGFKFDDGDEARNESAGMRISSPIELTVGAAYESGHRCLIRAAFMPTAISGVVEIAPSEQNEAP